MRRNRLFRTCGVHFFCTGRRVFYRTLAVFSSLTSNGYDKQDIMVRFWLDSPVAVLFDAASLWDFLPRGGGADPPDLADQLNRVMRLAAYFAAAMMLLGRMPAAVFAVVLAAVFTYAVHASSQRTTEDDEGFVQHGAACRRPVKHNPFMNPLPFEDPLLPRACDVDDPGIRRESKRLFDQDLYRDVSDVFHRIASDRQYYTVPVTTVPNDQTTFARWLYDAGPTCKEDQRRCRVRDFDDIRV
jgi:hypothetical protein